MGGVERADAPRHLIRGLPWVPGPVVLLARLAVDTGTQGHGLGMGLLFEATHRPALAAEHAAARLIAVDPISDRARSIYQRWAFRPVEDDPGGSLHPHPRRARLGSDRLRRTDLARSTELRHQHPS